MPLVQLLPSHLHVTLPLDHKWNTLTAIPPGRHFLDFQNFASCWYYHNLHPTNPLCRNLDKEVTG